MSNQNGSSVMVGVATVAGTIAGITAMLMIQKSQKQNERNQKLDKIRQRKRRYLERKMLEEIATDHQVGDDSKP